jgi:hypothetical protein
MGQHSASVSSDRTRLIISIAVMVTMGAVSLSSASAASAAGLLSSSTTVSASPGNTIVGSAVTLKATVKVLGLNGLGLTPRGSVSFSATNGTAVAPLGSVSMGFCFLNPCTANLVTTGLPIGTTSVTARYSGDGLSRPSSGSAHVSVIANPTPATSSTAICYSGQPCDTGPIVSSDGHTSLEISTAPSSSNQTLMGSLGTGQLQCPPAGVPDGDNDEDDGAPFPGALATFSSTATDVGKTIRYTGMGSLGALMEHEYSEHTTFVGCFGASHPFNGYTNGVYGAAPFNAADGLFESQLSNCANNSGQRPCFTNSAGAGTTDTYIVSTVPGDPKFIG